MIEKKIPLVEKLLKSHYPQIKFDVKCEDDEVHVYIPYTTTTIYNPQTFEPITVFIKDGNGEKIMIEGDFTDWEVYEPFNNFLPNIKLKVFKLMFGDSSTCIYRCILRKEEHIVISVSGATFAH
jgi:hypothetical protein